MTVIGHEVTPRQGKKDRTREKGTLPFSLVIKQVFFELSLPKGVTAARSHHVCATKLAESRLTRLARRQEGETGSFPLWKLIN